MDILSAVKGAIWFEKDEDGFFLPVRHGKERFERCKKLPNFAYALSGGGVRFDFYTDASEISFSYSVEKSWTGMYEDSMPKFDFLENGALVCTKELNTDGGKYEIVYSCENTGKKRVTVVFPANAAVKFGDADFGNFEKTPEKPCKFLILGDSVGGGFMNNSASNNFPFLLSEVMDFDFVNQSSGGDMFDCEMLEYVENVTDIIVGLGINEMVFTKNIAKTEARMSGFFERLYELYPDKNVYVITPTRICNENENPADTKLLAEISAKIREYAEAYRFETVDGTELLPHTKRYYSDTVHPNDLGFARMSLALLKKLKNHRL